MYIYVNKLSFETDIIGNITTQIRIIYGTSSAKKLTKLMYSRKA